MAKGESLKFEARIERAAVADYFESLAVAIRNSEMTLDSGHRSLSVSVASMVSFELAIQQEDDEASMEIELSWKTPQVSVAPPSLLISGMDPQIPEDGEYGRNEANGSVGVAELSPPELAMQDGDSETHPGPITVATKPAPTSQPSRRPRRSRKARGQSLESRTKAELYKMAEQGGIAGRGSMSKAQLIAALERSS
jgi:amphi-Trp domain-containing protein